MGAVAQHALASGVVGGRDAQWLAVITCVGSLREAYAHEHGASEAEAPTVAEPLQDAYSGHVEVLSRHRFVLGDERPRVRILQQ